MKKETDGRIIHITELASASAVTVTGIFLTLAAADVFPFSIDKCWLMSVYVCLFAISVIVAVMQKNMIGIGAAAATLMLIVAQTMILCGFAHRQIYPIYVLALPVGVALSTSFARYFGVLFKAAISLIGMGLLLFTESFSILNVQVVLPIIAVYYGILGVIYSCLKLKRQKIKENK